MRAGGDPVTAWRRVGFWYRLIIVLAKPLLRLLTRR
jgi:hypothetical protein